MKTYKPEGFGFGGRNAQPRYTVADIERAAQNGEILSGYVIKCDQNLGLVVKLGDNLTGYLPFDELEYSPYGDQSKPIAAISKVGRIIKFKVTKCDTAGEKAEIVLSRKASMQEAFEHYVDKLVPGDVIDAKITHVEKYGAFCDIACGLTYLLPIENFCVTRVDNAKEALKGIRYIKAIVSGKNKAGKLVLSHKELLGTWDSEAAKFETGNIVIGTVRSVEDYGVFIELTPNLSGLAEATDKVKAGDKVNVLIKSIIPEKMKIKLSILELEAGNFENDPKIEVEYRFTGDHMSKWVYSSEKSDKVIETVFDAEDAE